MITAGDLLDFILINKSDKTFKGMSKEEIAGAIIKGLDDSLILYSLEPTGNKIAGMILAEKDEDNKVIFVTENMAMSIALLRKFAQWCKQNYPGWNIEAMRHGKHRKFNTEKLYKKLNV